jgi:CheY-like chemotaxis protein
MGGLSIMLVEDEALIAMFLSDVLVEFGHTVCATVSTEAEAVACALRLAPDLMLVDLALGQGDGARAMRTILGARPQPHVFMTGARRADLPAGAHVLEKPFFAADLIRAIEAATAGAPGRAPGGASLAAV